MKMKCFVLVVFLIYCGGYVEMGVLNNTTNTGLPYGEGNTSASSEVDCSPGSTWEDECNDCRCTTTGSRVCTNRICPPDLPPRTIPLKKLNHTTAECLAGTAWQSKCHSCSCTQDSIAECVKIPDCVEEGEPLRCQPDSTFARDCNWCRCLETGFIICTLLECAPPQQINEEVLGVGKQCEVGTGWQSGCNRCYCDAVGEAYCTVDICPGQESGRVMQCAPGSRWRDACNQCECSNDGVRHCTIENCDENSSPDGVFPMSGFGKQCEIGTGWSSKCNICYCSEEGNAYCTVKSCPGEESEPMLQCAPGSRWNYECNSCECTPEGRPYCTSVDCHDNSIDYFREKRSTDLKDSRPVNLESFNKFNDVSGMQCKTGNSFKRKCNKCLCLDSGNFVCTKNICGDEMEVSTKLRVKKSTCRPRETFKRDCNTCKCSSDGLSYHCTDNECVEAESAPADVEVFMNTEGADHIEKHSVCRARSHFKVTCHTCVCNEDGSDYACPVAACPVPNDVELFHELRDKSSNKSIVCQANRMFVKDCNTCWCNGDGTSYYCTRRVCVTDSSDVVDIEDVQREGLRTIQRECRPNEVFELDCNMCRCNPDGKSFSCTRRLCISEPSSEDELDLKKTPTTTRRRRRDLNNKEPAKTCLPGQEFRLDCNKCLCDNEGQDFSCTRIDCAALNNHNGASRQKREVAERAVNQCEPGSVFDQDCNVCRCTTDGHHATCTIKRCSVKPSGEDNERLPESDPNFRCTPGEQFLRACNDCTCSADGRSVFCTLRLCEKDIAGQI